MDYLEGSVRAGRPVRKLSFRRWKMMAWTRWGVGESGRGRRI